MTSHFAISHVAISIEVYNANILFSIWGTSVTQTNSGPPFQRATFQKGTAKLIALTLTYPIPDPNPTFGMVTFRMVGRQPQIPLPRVRVRVKPPPAHDTLASSLGQVGNGEVDHHHALILELWKLIGERVLAYILVLISVKDMSGVPDV